MFGGITSTARSSKTGTSDLMSCAGRTASSGRSEPCHSLAQTLDFERFVDEGINAGQRVVGCLQLFTTSREHHDRLVGRAKFDGGSERSPVIRQDCSPGSNLARRTC